MWPFRPIVNHWAQPVRSSYSHGTYCDRWRVFIKFLLSHICIKEQYLSRIFQNQIQLLFGCISLYWLTEKATHRVSLWKKKMPQLCDFRLATAQPVVRAASLGRVSGVTKRGEHTVARFPSRAFTKKHSRMNEDFISVVRFYSVDSVCCYGKYIKMEDLYFQSLFD